MFTELVVNMGPTSPTQDSDMMLMRTLLFGATVCLCTPAIFAEETTDKDKAIPTHDKVAEVSLKGTGGLALQTLCADKEGRVIALVAQTRYFNAAGKKITSEVHVLSPEGKKVTEWKVDFHAHSLNVAPDGTV